MSGVRPDLPTEHGGTGRVEYNGFIFDAATRTDSVRITPVRDSADRTVIYSVFAFTIHTHIAGQSEAEVQEIRRRLTHDGKPFFYTDKGLGNLVVNVQGKNDVRWGPKVKELSWKPLGGGNAAALTWQIEVAIPDCDQAQFAFRAMEFVYTATFDVDQAGYTTRRIAGRLRIPQARVGGDGRQLLDSPDRYRERIVPAEIPGFRRTYGPWVIDESKTTLTFTIVDTEMGLNYPPEWVADVRARHHVSSSTAGLTTWQGTISADYELAKTAPDSWTPARHFFGTLVADRVKACAKKVGAKSTAIIPLAVSMDEGEIYGKRVSSFSYTFRFIRPLKDILAGSGLYRPVPESNWQKWSASLASSALHPRGVAKLTLEPGDDRITDLCDPGVARDQIRELRAGNFPIERLGEQVDRNSGTIANPAIASRIAELVSPKVEKESSYLFWECELFLEVDSGVAPVRLLPTQRLTAEDDVFGAAKDALGEAFDIVKAPAKLLIAPALAVKSIEAGVFSSPPARPRGVGVLENVMVGGSGSQRRVKAAAYVYLTGRASRAGFAVSPPRLIDVNGVPAVPANRLDRGEGFGQGARFAAGNTPIYTARWNLRYALDSVPDGDLPVVGNPVLMPPGS